MNDPDATSVEERAWLAMADQFLDTEGRHELRHAAACADALERLRSVLAPLEPQAREVTTCALSFLAARYVNFMPTDPASLTPDVLAMLEPVMPAFLYAIEPMTCSSDRRDGERAFRALSAQLANRRASGLSLRRLATEGGSFTEEFRLPFVLPLEVESELRTLYCGRMRAYHDLSHLAELFAHFHAIGGFHDPVAVALAILFHDGIYDAKSKDNEAKSAESMEHMLRSTGLVWPVARAKELVLLTARHGALQPRDVDEDAARFLDCDLAILASAPARYDAYERAIAAEYGHLPSVVYRVGRRSFLHTLLARPRLYLSDELHTRWDAPARANLRRTLGG